MLKLFLILLNTYVNIFQSFQLIFDRFLIQNCCFWLRWWKTQTLTDLRLGRQHFENVSPN